jgi:hypothetical protein
VASGAPAGGGQPGAGGQRVSALLAEQVAYHRARAPEHELGALPGAWGGEPEAALEAFAPGGDVLELACGPASGRRTSCATPTRSPR